MASKMAKDSEYDDLTFFVAPNGTPAWLADAPGRGSIGTVEVDVSMLRSSEDFPKDWPLTDFAKKDYLTHLQSNHASSREIYFRATRRGDDLERGILQGIGIRHEGSPVWWTDLDHGPVEAANLFDLARLPNKPQPWKKRRGKKTVAMWLLSLDQWDKAEYPPASQGGPPFVKGVSTAAERLRRRRKKG